MVTITILDLTKRVYTFDDGFLVFSKIHDAFSKGEEVILSFKGIDAIPSSFANGCFVKLLSEYGIDMIKKNLQIIESTKQINTMIKARFAFEAQRIKDE